MKVMHEQQIWRFTLAIPHHIEEWIFEDFASLEITKHEKGSTLVEGVLPDLAAFYGLLLRLRDMGVDIHTLTLQCDNES